MNLKTLIKLYHECQTKNYTSPKIIEQFLNREPNHVANILKFLEFDDLIIRRREQNESKIFMTELGNQVAKEIINELELT
ncbi:MAG: hypothetical protein ACFFGP_04840 [Promethearchaeota archaeon]